MKKKRLQGNLPTKAEKGHGLGHPFGTSFLASLCTELSCAWPVTQVRDAGCTQSTDCSHCSPSTADQNRHPLKLGTDALNSNVGNHLRSLDFRTGCPENRICFGSKQTTLATFLPY